MHRQGKNDQGNDTSKIFMSIPIGSTVAVQQEDGGPWTYGTVVDKGDHNHHNRSYKTQVTKTGRIITCNRQPIRPKPITAENFLYNQLSKHTRTDPLDTILDHIQRCLPPHTTKHITNERPNSNIMRDAQKETNSTQDTKEKQREEEDMNTISDKKQWGKDCKNQMWKNYKKKQTGLCMNANTKTFTQATCQTLCKSQMLYHLFSTKETLFHSAFWLTGQPPNMHHCNQQ